MRLERVLGSAALALVLCAGCASGTSSVVDAPATGGPAVGPGFGRPYDGGDTPRCTGGSGFNRATGLCVGPGGP
jgi:hypothetical protein